MRVLGSVYSDIGTDLCLSCGREVWGGPKKVVTQGGHFAGVTASVLKTITLAKKMDNMLRDFVLFILNVLIYGFIFLVAKGFYAAITPGTDGPLLFATMVTLWALSNHR
jgi:hypothetical protein